MKFGPVPLLEAAGAILAHSQHLQDRTLHKGMVLDEPALAALITAGHREVIAARLEPGDVPENIAAERLATPLAGSLLTYSRAATGRVNLLAEAPGVITVDSAKIDRLNSIDESLTIGTLPDHAVVAAKDLVATIKVIPFAVPGTILTVAEALARQGQPAFALHPFKPLSVGLVVTTLPGMKESVVEKTIAVTTDRVTAMTGSILPAVVTAHNEGAIAAGLHRLMTQGASLLLIVGASAVVDRRDVGPSAIISAGGEILHFGMPVDPGNLICLGRIAEIPALVLPGCARSPKINGIDFVLARIFSGLPMTPTTIMRMGVGGLLMEIDTRPMPRAKAPATPSVGVAPKSVPPIAAIILAAGRSRRMAPQNKLLVTDRSGKAMIARVVDNVLSSHARPILVVTGHMHEQVELALSGRPVRFVHAADFADGLAASLKAGIAAIPEECAAAIVCLGDMPLVTGRMIDKLLDAYSPTQNRRIVMPTFRGKQGNPMLWDRSYFTEILELSGDTGARYLAARHVDNLIEIEMADDAVLRDFDTAASLDTLPPKMRPPATSR